MNVVATDQPNCAIVQYNPTASILTKFILHCTSVNLLDSIRVLASPQHIVSVVIGALLQYLKDQAA